MSIRPHLEKKLFRLLQVSSGMPNRTSSDEKVPLLMMSSQMLETTLQATAFPNQSTWSELQTVLTNQTVLLNQRTWPLSWIWTPYQVTFCRRMLELMMPVTWSSTLQTRKLCWTQQRHSTLLELLRLYQPFSLHAFAKSGTGVMKQILLACCLMSRRTKKDYKTVLQCIKKLPARGIHLKEVVVDYEQSTSRDVPFIEHKQCSGSVSR